MSLLFESERNNKKEELRGIKVESKSQKAKKKIQELNESQRIRQVPALIVRPPGVIDFSWIPDFSGRNY